MDPIYIQTWFQVVIILVVFFSFIFYVRGWRNVTKYQTKESGSLFQMTFCTIVLTLVGLYVVGWPLLQKFLN